MKTILFDLWSTSLRRGGRTAFAAIVAKDIPVAVAMKATTIKDVTTITKDRVMFIVVIVLVSVIVIVLGIVSVIVLVIVLVLVLVGGGGVVWMFG